MCMTSLLHPVGPEDPKVYWRRRVAVGAVVLVLIMGIGFLLLSGSGAGTASPQSAEASPAASPDSSAAQPDPDSSPTPQPAASSSGASDSSSQSPSAQRVQACSDESISVFVSTDAESYGADANPQVTLTIANTGSKECRRDIGAAANEVIIQSGGFHVWSSDDCNPGDGKDVQALPAGAQAQVTVAWDRKLSEPGCSSERRAAAPGTYTVKGRNLQVTSEESTFILR